MVGSPTLAPMKKRDEEADAGVPVPPPDWAMRLKASRIEAGYKTAKEFADEMGMPQPTYQQHESGKHEPSLEQFFAYADKLDKSRAWLITGEKLGEPTPYVNDGRQRRHVVIDLRAAQREIPILGTSACGEAGAFQFDDNEPIGFVPRPSGLAEVPDVYALKLRGESMWPAFEAADIVFVHPRRRASAGDYVCLQVIENPREGMKSYIKRLVSISDERVVVEQLNPSARREFKRTTVVAVHRVLRINDVVGV